MKKIALIFFIGIVVSCLFVGCRNDAIQFKTESRFQDVMKNVQSDKPKVYNSSGVAIYKDQSKTNTTQGSNANDMKFDLNIKF